MSFASTPKPTSEKHTAPAIVEKHVERSADSATSSLLGQNKCTGGDAIIDPPDAEMEVASTFADKTSELVALAQQYQSKLSEAQRERRAVGKAKFEQEQARKPKKHPDDYRYGAQGYLRTEIEQYRRENPEVWNEYQRAKYAVRKFLSGSGEVRQYRRDSDEQLENRRATNRRNASKRRAAMTPEEREIAKVIDADQTYERRKAAQGKSPEEIEAGLVQRRAKRAAQRKS